MIADGPGVEFSAAGHPIPQGSARAFVVKGRAVITSDNPALKAWRKVVAAAALEARGDADPYDGPVVVVLEFRMPRPKTVKRDYPTGAREGDVDKLSRAVLDALTTSGLIVDDSRVVRLVADQVYDTDLGVTVWVRAMDVPRVVRGSIEGKK